MKRTCTPHAFTTDDGEYCNHRFPSGATCNRPKESPAHDGRNLPIAASSYYDLPDDRQLVDDGIRRCLEAGMTAFSANDMQEELQRVKNRKMPGTRFQAWLSARLIVKLPIPKVPSNNPKAKGHEVTVYGPGPEWLAQKKVSA